MEIIEHKLEMRGMPRGELVDYFINIGGKDHGDGEYIGDGWKVKIHKEVLVKLGPIKVPSTLIILNVEEEKNDDILAGFRLKFLTVGG